MKSKCLICGALFLLLLLTPFATRADDRSAALQKLYEAAKKEGTLVIHDGGVIGEIRPIADIFERRFPGIKVQIILQPTPTIPTRLIAEAQAGRLTIDAASGSVSGYILDLLKRDLIRKLDLPKVVDIDPSNVWGGGILFIEASVVPVFVYNTNLVSPTKEPRAWEDLLDPQWKGGKIYLGGFGNLLASLFFTWKESEAVEYLKKLRQQDLVFRRDPRSATNAVASGEAHIGEGFARTFTEVKKRGAPVEIAPISPVVYIPDGTYAVKGSPHPNAGELWVAWRQTQEGREATLKFADEAPESKCENSPSAQALCKKGIKFRVLETLEDARLRGEYETKVRGLLGITPGK